MSVQVARGRRRAAATSAGAATRERILSTAFRLFHERGYHATGVADILRASRVNAGSLYHAFPSKDALLRGVLEHALEILRPAVIAPAEARSDDPIGRVFALLAGYRERMVACGCRKGCPVGNLALEVSDGDARARALVHRNFEAWAGEVGAWLRAAGDRLPEDADRARLARFVLTVMEGALMQARAARSLTPFDEAVIELGHYFDLLAERAAAKTKTKTKTKKTTKKRERRR